MVAEITESAEPTLMSLSATSSISVVRVSVVSGRERT